jgi:hypothetical protein
MIFMSRYSNTTGAANGAGAVHPSGTPEVTHVFSGVRVARSLVFCENHFSVISWQLALLKEETGENHRPVARHKQSLSHIVV